MDLFEKATKYKFRFPSSKGDLTTERLWELPLRTRNANAVCLNSVAKAVNDQIKEFGEEDFVGGNPEPGKALAEDKMKVVKHIIAVRQEEIQRRQQAQETEMRRQHIRELLARKDEEADQAKTREELEEELKNLENKSA